MNKLSKLIFGEREPWQSDVDYEAGKPLTVLFWFFVIFCAGCLVKFIVSLLG